MVTRKEGDRKILNQRSPLPTIFQRFRRFRFPLADFAAAGGAAHNLTVDDSVVCISHLLDGGGGVKFRDDSSDSFQVHCRRDLAATHKRRRQCWSMRRGVWRKVCRQELRHRARCSWRSIRRRGAASTSSCRPQRLQWRCRRVRHNALLRRRCIALATSSYVRQHC